MSKQPHPSSQPLEPAQNERERSAKQLTPAAERALAEAAERRRFAREEQARKQKELGGRGGPDPVRYGDWEKDGIVSDF